MFYRIKQFFLALTAKLDDQDRALIRRYLTDEEQKLFSQLRIYDQKHSINVARRIINIEDMDHDEFLIRAGLLHDIGKSKYPLNPFEKGVIVILDKLSRGKIRRVRRLKIVKCYYEHAEIGYTLLRETGVYCDSFLTLIREHHSKEGTEDKRLIYLKACDDQS